jgi:uncharacterized protein YebE (UPF0316 family)
MDLQSFLGSGVFHWVVLPMMIFFARVLDVSLGTMRIILIARGKRGVVPVIGFIEVFIWISVMSQLMSRVDNPFYMVAYSAGFAMGNYIGMLIENKLAIGKASIRVISSRDILETVAALRKEGFGVTVVDGWGSKGPVRILYTIVRRKEIQHAVEIIRTFDEKAFYTIEDVREAKEGVFLRDPKLDKSPQQLWLRKKEK